jgi:hypothetical protein
VPGARSSSGISAANKTHFANSSTRKFVCHRTDWSETSLAAWQVLEMMRIAQSRAQSRSVFCYAKRF